MMSRSCLISMVCMADLNNLGRLADGHGEKSLHVHKVKEDGHDSSWKADEEVVESDSDYANLDRDQVQYAAIDAFQLALVLWRSIFLSKRAVTFVPGS